MDAWNRTVNVEGDSPATLLLELKAAVPRDFHGMEVVTLTISKANRDAFVQAVAELIAAPGKVSEDVIDAAWQDLCEADDRTSPAEYPDHCLITRDELAQFMRRPSI